MENSNLLSVGAGPEQIASIKKASALGFSIIGIDADPHAPGFQHCAEHYCVDIKDHAAVVALARSKDIRAVVPSPLGKYITIVGLVNDTLNLTGPRYEACKICADKQLFSQALGKTVEHVAIQRIKENYQSGIAFPLVVKPSQGAGSRNVFLLQNKEDWFRWATQADVQEYPDGVLIERYHTGISLGVDAIVQEGVLHIVLVREKEIINETTILEVGYYARHDVDLLLYQRLHSALSSIVLKIGLKNCLLHADIIVEQGEVVIIEMSPRPSGLHISSNLIPLSTGIDFLSEGIKLVTGSNVDFRSRKAHWGIRYLDFKAGTIVRTPSIEDIRNVASKNQHEINVRVGQRTEMPISVADLLKNGFVMVNGASSSEVKEKFHQIMSMFVIQ